jgi:uncharacterized protein (DUF2147 family)
MKSIITSLIIALSLNVLGASVVGTWITIDDETGKKKSKVKLYKSKGKMYGRIVYLFPREGRPKNAKCTKCTGDRKNKPLVNLQIVRSMVWDGSVWKDGNIVDPENGKIYDCKMWLDPKNSDRLKVRGYVSFFYRTQTWKRVQE